MAINKLILKLFEIKELAHCPRYLTTIAIAIQHIDFHSKRDPQFQTYHEFVKRPIDTFFENQISLLEASKRFSDQNPLDSDLFHLVREIAAFGPLFIQLPLFEAGLKELNRSR